MSGALAVQRSLFGLMPDGTTIDRYTLGNASGMRVSVITYGARVQAITVPNRNGEYADVVLGYDDLPSYLEDRSTYFGATVGRYANRIAQGRFSLNGLSYRVPPNHGAHALHGGPRGFDSRVWTARAVQGAHRIGVVLRYHSPDGEMGFPGNLEVSVRYTLNDAGALEIDYSAITDADTVVNLTNHTYFNLAGVGQGSILDHVAQINAARYTPVDDTLIPTGEIHRVKGTALDFTVPTPIGERLQADWPVTAGAAPCGTGYDCNWVLDQAGDVHALAVRVVEPRAGRCLELYTSEPGVQCYTANFLQGIRGKNGYAYGQWSGLALEAQHYPDSPNHPHFPSTTLRAGERYRQTTIYKFSPC